MHRVAAIVVVAVAIASCGGGDAEDDGVVDRTREVPADVRAFLDRVVDPSALHFAASYALLNRNGGREHDVRVESVPPALTITIDGEEVDLEDAGALARFGIFAGFLAEAPAAAIEATARRVDAGDAVFSERGDLECIAVPVQQVAASTWCLAPVGIFGFVDTPSVRFELTAFEPAP